MEQGALTCGLSSLSLNQSS